MTRVLLLDENRGIYIPQVFARDYDWSLWDFPADLNKEELQGILLSGPDNKQYWDAWEDILRNAVYFSKGEQSMAKGTWHLEQDGDLWAVHESEYEDKAADGAEEKSEQEAWLGYEPGKRQP